MLPTVSVNMFLANTPWYAAARSRGAGGGMTLKRLVIVVSGRVQGVWFRASTREEATRLGLQGWVRNLPDGRVEALFEGEEHPLRQMLEWCRSGPPGARVDEANPRWGTATNEYEGFSIRP
jgi:acylphosphatase